MAHFDCRTTGVGNISNDFEKLQVDEKGRMTAKLSNSVHPFPFLSLIADWMVDRMAAGYRS